MEDSADDQCRCDADDIGLVFVSVTVRSHAADVRAVGHALAVHGFEVLGDGLRFVLGDVAVHSDEHLIGHFLGVDVLLFEVDRNTLGFQRPNSLQTVKGVSCKS